MDLELNTPTSVEVAVESAIGEIDNLVVSIDGTDALEVTFDSNEFSIVGDDMVVVTKYDDAPQWLKDTIDNIVNIKTAVAVGNLNTVKEALDVMLGELDIAKNTYQLSIISSDDINQRITTAITSLNSALRDADATILDIANTAVTPSEASAIALNTLSASLSSNGEIGSAIHNLQTAMTTLQGTTAESISYLESTMEGEINSNASAMQTIRTYVGIDEVGASTGTGLSGYLEGSDGTIGGADSQLVNDIKVNAEVVESKWAYNSTLMLAGKYYKSGFGLESSIHTSGSGTQIDPYTSEFWIDASRFKFTNSNQTGQVAPFTIDASGSQPQITFNGKVSFSNVTNVPQLGSTPQEVVDAVNAGNTTTINGGKITTNSITAAQIQANSLSADRLIAGTSSSTVWSGGGLVSQNFNGNPYGNIGSPTQGFRLSSGAAGTSTDPNIYGAYIKGAIVDGSYMKYSTNSLFLTAYDTLAPYAIFSSVNGYGSGLFYFDRLYSPTGSGDDVYRLSKYNQKVTVFGGFAGDYDVIYAAIQYKYNNDETWYTTFTRSIYADYRAGVAFSSSFNLKSTPYGYVDVRINVYGYAPEASSATLQVSNI